MRNSVSVDQWVTELRKPSHDGCTMTRGQQKIQAQQRNAKKQADLKKSTTDQKKAASKALIHQCTVCKTQMPDLKTYRQHFENKHPKNPLPEELKDVVA
ncbi:zinc finger protein 706 [Clonorchis sinensis]|uniref:Zinc finger protein 706 n=2 Tax=Clonorchis sinensis TaxID=79923 RepID=H2KRB1_CLOSI|nr:zinc finger protein 706 [Clonorchis sinensis]